MLRRILVLALLVAMLFSTSCICLFRPSSVECPGVTGDNSGGVIVAYEVYKGDSRNVYVQRISPGGEILWGEKGVPLYIAQGRTEGGGKTALAIADGYGGVILVWWEEQGLFAQKMDSEGYALWQEAGILASTGYVGNYKMVSDSLGGAIISWSDDWGKLYLQRVDSEGSLLWMEADAPIHLRTHPMAASHTFDITSDDSGGAIIVWESKGRSIFAQKIDSKGKVLWQQNGLLVCAQHQFEPQAVSDGSGGAIVVWEHGIPCEKDSHGYCGSDIYAQKIDDGGNILWQPDGVPICIGSPMAVDPHIISDGLGGAIVTWRAPCSIYAQRIDSKGNILWQEDGVKVWEAEGPQSPNYCVVADGLGGAITVWKYVEEGKKVDQGGILRAQRLDAMGRKLWETNGTLVSTGSWGYCYPPTISQDGHGGVIIAWTAGKGVHSANLSYVQRIDAQGNLVWGEKGILLNG